MSTNTWLTGNLPTISDFVTINTGHTITIPSANIAQAGRLLDKGILNIENTAILQMGTATANPTALQNIDFSYHIRGSLKGINLDASGNVALNGGDLFSMKLGFEEDGTYFDGNIRSQKWISSIDNLSRTYTHRYDGASRIKAGVYSGGKTGENYTLGNVNYDNNGNITNLLRNGLRSNNSFGIVDNLNYTYQSNSNKIQAVADNSNETASFTDATGTTDYTYLADGSLRSDANKGISLFEYNYLKKPNKITFSDGRTISYQYSASGKKLKETTSTNEITDYVGNVIYKNGSVYQVSHDEGRTVNNVFEYDIKDHLGSLRVSFKDSLSIAKVTQESHTGIFGEVLPSLVYTNTPKTDNFDYTGHERLKTFNLGYIDAGARLYDPIVPRFTTLDPLAELSRRFSPTVYGNNNPIRFIDPDGMRSKDYTSPSGYYKSDLGAGGEQDNEDEKDKGKKTNTGRGGGDNGTPFSPPEHLQASSLQNASISQGRMDYFSPEDKAAQTGVNIAGAVEGGFSLAKGLALLKNGLNGLKALFGLSKNQISVEGIISDVLRIQKQADLHTVNGLNLGGRSYLNSIDDAKSVLNAAHNGEATVLSTNVSQNRAYVLYKDVTGYYNNNGVIMETNKFLIKGGKSATVVPIHPNSITFK